MGFRIAATLCALLALTAMADAQVIHYLSSATINYDVRGRDILVDGPLAFPSVLTVADNGLISRNADASDGLEGVELFNANELHVTGGTIAAEGGAKGGVRLHDSASAQIRGGAVNAMYQRGEATSVLTGGVTGEIALLDGSFGYLLGGSLSLVSVYDSAKFEAWGGRLGANVYVFGGSARFFGSGFRVLKAKSAMVSGYRGVTYTVTGFLHDGGRLLTDVFINGATLAGKTTGTHLLVNDAAITVQAAAPDASAGALAAMGLFGLALHGGRRSRRQFAA